MANGSRILVALGIIVVLALLAFGVYRVLRPAQTQRPTTPTLTLLDYVDRDTQVRFTTEGPVTANERHSSIRITVTRDNRVLEVFSTYADEVTISQTFTNNEAAFEDFMHALQDAEFIRRNPRVTEDEKGACPTGQRYIYELLEGSTTASRLWSSSCSEGSFNGNAGLVRQLFQAQIPDYQKTVSGVRMSL